MNESSSTIAQIVSSALESIGSASSLAEMEDLRVRFLGKKSDLTGHLKSIGTLPAEERRGRGQEINAAKVEIESQLSERVQALQETELLDALERQSIDVSLPGRTQSQGNAHPITRSRERIEAIFTRLGFDIADGPEMEDDFHNFQALNIPPDHPARDMQDTFYVDDERVLRTHTSPVQIRYMEQNKPPLSVIAPGRVYRVDSDVTHTPMFHQVEGLVLDTDVNFADLKGVLTHFINEYFEANATLKFRPSYFPFTEPSAEVDMSCIFCESRGCRICSHTGWLEILGCGMVHPQVLKNVDIDPEVHQGYAFGMGIERLTMLRYGVDDIRLLFENDLNVLKQFN